MITALCSLLLILTVQDNSYVVSGDGENVTVSTPDGTLPEFVPVPVNATGVFTYKVTIVPTADGAADAEIKPLTGPVDYKPAATFTVKILPAGVALEGENVPDAQAALDVTMHRTGDTVRTRFRGQGAHMVMAYVLPARDGTFQKTLEILSRDGVSSATRSTAAGGVQDPERPAYEPPPTLPVSPSPIKMLVLSTASSFESPSLPDDTGYGLGCSLSLSPWGPFTIDAFTRYRTLTSGKGEILIIEETCVDDVCTTTILEHHKFTLDISVADIGLGFGLTLADWLKFSFEVAVGQLMGDIRGDTQVWSASAKFSTDVLGGVFALGFEQFHNDAVLDIPQVDDFIIPDDPVGTIDTVTASYMITF